MRTVKHFFHFHKGSPEDRILKILGAFFLVLMIVMWAAAQTTRAAHEETITTLSQTVPEPSFYAPPRIIPPMLLSQGPVLMDTPCSPQLRDMTLFDVKQNVRALQVITQELERLGGKTPQTPRLDKTRETMLMFENRIYQAAGNDAMCNAVKQYWQDPVHGEIPYAEHLLTLPKRLNRIFALSTGLNRQLNNATTKQNLESAGIATEKLSSAVAVFLHAHQQALEAFRRSQFETADQLLTQLETQNTPSELTALIGVLAKDAWKANEARDLINNGHYSAALLSVTK